MDLSNVEVKHRGSGLEFQELLKGFQRLIQSPYGVEIHRELTPDGEIEGRQLDGAATEVDCLIMPAVRGQEP